MQGNTIVLTDVYLVNAYLSYATIMYVFNEGILWFSHVKIISLGNI